MLVKTPAVRRYNRRLAVALLAYFAALFGTNWALRHLDLEGAALVTVAILPALPIAAVIGVIGLYLVEERDEYLRQRIVTAMLIGLGFALSVMCATGFLGEAGVIEQPPGYWAFVLWCAGWAGSQGLLQLRDRRADRAA